MSANEPVPPEAMRLYGQAQGYWDARPPRTAEAIHCWEHAAEICRQAGAPTVEARLLNCIGMAYRSQSDYGTALEYYRRASAIFQAVAPGSTDVAASLNNIGYVHACRGDLDRALEHYLAALEIDEVIAPCSADTAIDFNNIGGVYDALGNLPRALEFYERALAIDQRIAPHSTEVAIRLNNIGSVHSSQGNLTKALQYYDRAAQIVAAIDPVSSHMSAILTQIGGVCRCQGKLDAALDYYRRALAIDHMLCEKSADVANVLTLMAAVYRSQGDLSHARVCLQRALAIDEAIAPESIETARNVSNIGTVYGLQGNPKRALEFFQRALAIDEACAPQSSEAGIRLGNIGNVYFSQGNMATALEYFQRALAIHEAIAPQSADTATDLSNIGGVYLQQGDVERAGEYYARASAINQRIAPHSLGTVMGLNEIGLLFLSCGELPFALDFFRRALATAETIAPESLETAAILNNMGQAYHRRADLANALEHYLRALAIHEAIAPQSEGTAVALANIGCAYEAQHDSETALQYLGRALAIWETIAPRSRGTAVCLGNMGFVHRSQGDSKGALEFCERCLEIAESLRGQAAGGQRGKAAAFAEHVAVYEMTIELLGRMGKPRLGFVYAERSRARGMVELLAERHIDASARAPDELLAEERRLEQRVTHTYAALLEARGDPRPDFSGRIPRLEAELDRFEREMEALETRIRRECPEYADLEYPQPLRLEDVQQQVLGADDALLEYFVGEENSCVWAVRRDRYEFHVLHLKSAELDEQVHRRLRPRVDNPNEPIAPNSQIAAARRLYEGLVAPAEIFLQGAERILISPDGPLHYLPFEALVCGDQSAHDGNPFQQCVFLGERYVISYLPSATVLKNIRDAIARQGNRAKGQLIALGDPDYEAAVVGDGTVGSQRARQYAERHGVRLERIPATGTEVREIFTLFAGETGAGDRSDKTILEAEGCRAYLRHEASERRAKSESAGYRYVHFATHAFLDDKNPLYSGVVFSPTAAARDPDSDGLLQTYEIFAMRLNADLVTLSACKTGLGRLTKGEGLVGMTRAFMYAGTPSVLVSLWSVADEETAQFMIDFYRRIRRGHDKATALAEAKRLMMKDAEHPHRRDPFYWAAFVLQGEWRSSPNQ